MTVLAVTGLNREAAIVAGPGVVTVASGGDVASLRSRIEAALLAPSTNFGGPPSSLRRVEEIAGIISIGIAGALDPTLKVGDIIIATEVLASSLLPTMGKELGMGVTPVRDEAEVTSAAADDITPVPAPFPKGGRAIDHDWAERLAAALPQAHRGAIVGSNLMIVDAAAKAQLHRQTCALCVDMESHIAAEVAAAHGLPFAALRFISDDASRALPKAAQAGMKPDGGMDILAVLKSLVADPRQLPALIRTGLEAETAFRALLRSRHRLSAALGFADVEGLHLP